MTAGIAAVALRKHEPPVAVVEAPAIAPPVPAPAPAPARPTFEVIVSEPTIVEKQTKKTKAARVDRAPGSISVRVQPWADVLLDGKAVGTTPLQPFSASAGRHELTLVNSKLKQTKVVKVDVQPGKTVAVEVNLQR